MASGDGAEDPLDALADAFVERRRRGEAVTVDAFAAAHPEHADAIRELFPTLVAVERAVGADAGCAGPVTFPGLVVLRELAPGIGGFGRVFECRETSLDRVVAVKTLQEHVRTPEGRATFEREARAAAGLDHPNILKVHSFHPDHQPPYLVMKYVDGAPLDVACEGRDARFVAEVVEKVARALDFSHRHGIVHRDVKPDNILVDRSGQPHVTDFGLARPLDHGGLNGNGNVGGNVGGNVSGNGAAAAPGALRATTIKGTPRFIPPEVFEGRGTAGPAADVYALGVTLYTVLCKRTPFPGTSFGEIRRRVIEADPPFPQDVDPEVPEALQRICLKAMEREPGDRYESAGAMAADLQRFRSGLEVTARPQRYARELRGRLRTHLAEIRGWRDRELIDVSWMDRLARPYQRLLGSETAIRRTATRFPWDVFLLRLGGMLVLVTTVLWPAFYWHRLGPWERVLAAFMPTVLLNGVGWWAHRRGNPRAAVPFLAAGIPLVPLLVGVVLTEFHLFATPQTGLELYPHAGDPSRFAPTNLQITLAMLSLLVYAVVTLLVVRSRRFAAWAAVGAWLCFFGFLALFGLRTWIESERLGGVSIACGAFAVLFVPAGRLLAKVEDGRWSSVLYAFFPVPCAVSFVLLCLTGTRQWVDPAAEWTDPSVQHRIMLLAPLVAFCAWRCATAHVGFARFWAPFFLAFLPICILTPANVLFTKRPSLFVLGSAPFTVYEATSLAVSIAAVALGTRIRRSTLVTSGLLGAAVFLLRATDRHFAGAAGWALLLSFAGAVALSAGAVLLWRSAERRARPEPGRGPETPDGR